MRHVYQALKEVLRDYPEAEAIFPMHKNPKVREVAEQVLGKMDRVHLSLIHISGRNGQIVG